ncbi:zinc finger protein 501-like [Drosophila innubila]|uniref:zinc finger protein 501-like n=1 Tax=Drosophila innubila TaxID=198719 RepID=UPI00148E17E5|nr:zinc finger protein 501-like [Drosophila innubila]
MKPVCRACMGHSVNLVELFSEQPQSEAEPSLLEMLTECVNCEVNRDDPLSKMICLTCVIAVKNAFRFKRKCEESHEHFWRLLNKEKKQNEEQSNDIMPIQSEWIIDELDCIKNEVEERTDNSWDNILPENLQQEEENSLSWTVDNCTTDPLSQRGCEANEKCESEINITIADATPCSNEKTHLCDTCGKEFPDMATLTEHILVHNDHTDDRQFVCPHCSRRFKKRANLQAHIQIHTGDRPYECHICPKAFVLSHHLKDHIQNHSGERPFACPHCPKAFNRSWNLQSHLLVHSGERPYVCTVCSSTFNHPSNLEKHIRLHSGKRPHQCPHCAKSFTRRQHLNTHVLVHTGERPYTCEKCQRDFKSRPGLRNHVCQKVEDKQS